MTDYQQILEDAGIKGADRETSFRTFLIRGGNKPAGEIIREAAISVTGKTDEQRCKILADKFGQDAVRVANVLVKRCPNG